MVITYNGTLYETQNIEIFLEGLKLFIDQNPDKKITFNLPGILFDQKQANRVLKNMEGYESHLVMTDRISKEEVIEIQQNSDLLLMVSHSNIKGVTSSKIFEYISLQKPIMLCPNDHDVLEEIATKSGLGKVMNSAEEVVHYLNNIIDNNRIEPDLEKLRQFGVRIQVRNLTKIII
jgi:glycosyltransferase involved in cell wall biosynthesis